MGSYFFPALAGLGALPARSLLGRRNGLAAGLALGLHGQAHDHATALRTRDGAADQEQVALDVHFDDLQVFHGAAHHAHVTRHALALEHAARRLALADGARGTMRQRDTVGGMVAGEVVPLHGAGKALADGGAGHVDDFADLETVDLELGAFLQVRTLTLGEAEFHQAAARAHRRLRQVAGGRLGEQLGALGAEGDLHGPVAVDFLGLKLGHAIGQYFDDGHRHGFAGVRKHPRHPRLATDQTNRVFHGLKFTNLVPQTRAAARSLP